MDEGQDSVCGGTAMRNTMAESSNPGRVPPRFSTDPCAGSRRRQPNIPSESPPHAAYRKTRLQSAHPDPRGNRRTFQPHNLGNNRLTEARNLKFFIINLKDL